MSQTLPPDFDPFENTEEEQEELSLPAPQKQMRPGVRTALWTLVILVAVAGILFGGVFQIRHVEIVGATHFSRDEILAQAGLSKPVPYFSLEEDQVRADLERNHYLILEKAEPRFPNALTLYIRERVPCANVQTMGVYYLLAKDGMVLAQNPEGLADQMMLVTGLMSKDVRVGSYIVPGSEAQLEALRTVLEEMSLQKCLNLFSELNLSNVDSLCLVTTDGYTARLGDSSDMRAKLGTLRAVVSKLREMGKTGGVIEASSPGSAMYTPPEG